MQRVFFFGSSDYCLPILESLNSHFKLIGVVTRPDKPIGRSQELAPSAVKLFAQQHGILSFTPKTASELLLLKNELESLHIDLFIVADFGMIIPTDIFELPKYKTLNIHFSRLPKLRGASPVQYTILLGEASAWITIQKMEKTLDTGDIVWQKEITSYNNELITINSETTKSLYTKLFKVVHGYLPDVIRQYTEGKLIPTPQDHSQATYTRRLTRDDGFIPWEILKATMNGTRVSDDELTKWPAFSLIDLSSIMNHKSFIINELRAFSPWPGVWTELQITNLPTGEAGNKQQITKRLKILKAHLEVEKLVLDEVQLEGKNPVSWEQFSRVYLASKSP